MTTNEQFRCLLPAIEVQAKYALRYLNVEALEDAVAEVAANAFVAFRRLLELGKSAFAFPAALARYAVAQFKAGRRVGTLTNTSDVTSPAARLKHSHKEKSFSRWGSVPAGFFMRWPN